MCTNAKTIQDDRCLIDVLLTKSRRGAPDFLFIRSITNVFLVAPGTTKCLECWAPLFFSKWTKNSHGRLKNSRIVEHSRTREKRFRETENPVFLQLAAQQAMEGLFVEYMAALGLCDFTRALFPSFHHLSR